MTPAAAPARPLRIGELAERAGTTPRTIRYYEELGLLGGAAGRAHGRHRTYTDDDVERLTHILRLRDLLGLSLDELRRVLEAEDARAAIRRALPDTEDPARRLTMLDEALGHIATQLELVERRQAELDGLASELHERRARILRRRAELVDET